MSLSNSFISAEFPFESKYVEIDGSKIHYIDEGNGDPIVFLHGMMTCNYLWRNIIPTLKPLARCIAPDYIGMGKSDKPDLDYVLADHINYIDKFINKLGLKNITLVMHAWGSVIGTHYAAKNPDKIKGLVFIEGILKPIDDVSMLSLPAQELIKLLDSPDKGYKAVIEENFLLEKVLPAIELRRFSDKEMAYYREPFKDPKSRKPLLQYIKDLPLPNGPKETRELVSRNSEFLQKSPLPKLLLYAIPGFLLTIPTVAWAKKHIPNLAVADVGESFHYPEETNPAAVREAIRDWYNLQN